MNHLRRWINMTAVLCEPDRSVAEALRPWITAAMLLTETPGSWLYHGTSQHRLARIQQEGLRPQMTGNYEDYGDGDDHASWSYGKVFFVDSLSSAMFYAHITAKNDDSQPAILRTHPGSVEGLQSDPHGEFGDESYTEEPLSPAAFEVQTARTKPHWVALLKYPV